MDQTVPIIFYAFCYTSGTAILIGTFLWLHDVHSKKLYTHTLKQTLLIWIYRSAFVTLLFSFMINYHTADKTLHLYPEIILILGFIGTFALQSLNNSKIKTSQPTSAPFFKESFHLLLFLCLSVWVWGMSILIVTALARAIQLIHSVGFGSALPLHPIRDSVLILGLLWIAPYLYLYNAIQKGRQKKTGSTTDNFCAQHILWPLLIAVGLFALPLAIDATLQSYKNTPRPDKPQILDSI